jgi:hypothetical protein
MSARTGVIRLRLIFGVATALGFFSAFQAYYYVSTFSPRPDRRPSCGWRVAAHWNVDACGATCRRTSPACSRRR